MPPSTPTATNTMRDLVPGGRGPYKKGYRHENNERKFWRHWFGSFGDGCNRSFLSRGADVSFFDYLLRRWKVSCKVKNPALPKWMWKELETHDILSIKEDGKLPVRLILESKLEELLTKAMRPTTPEINEVEEST
jgi:hypothetical protein